MLPPADASLVLGDFVLVGIVPVVGVVRRPVQVFPVRQRVGDFPDVHQVLHVEVGPVGERVDSAEQFGVDADLPAYPAVRLRDLRREPLRKDRLTFEPLTNRFVQVVLFPAQGSLPDKPCVGFFQDRGDVAGHVRPVDGVLTDAVPVPALPDEAQIVRAGKAYQASVGEPYGQVLLAFDDRQVSEADVDELAGFLDPVNVDGLCIVPNRPLRPRPCREQVPVIPRPLHCLDNENQKHDYVFAVTTRP